MHGFTPFLYVVSTPVLCVFTLPGRTGRHRIVAVAGDPARRKPSASAAWRVAYMVIARPGCHQAYDAKTERSCKWARRAESYQAIFPHARTVTFCHSPTRPAAYCSQAVKIKNSSETMHGAARHGRQQVIHRSRIRATATGGRVCRRPLYRTSRCSLQQYTKGHHFSSARLRKFSSWAMATRQRRAQHYRGKCHSKMAGVRISDSPFEAYPY